MTPSLILTGSETDIVAFVSNKAVLVTISSHCVVESAASPSLTIGFSEETLMPGVLTSIRVETKLFTSESSSNISLGSI